MNTRHSVQSSVNSDKSDKSEDKKPARGGLVDEKLFNSRAITIFGEINDKIKMRKHQLAPQIMKLRKLRTEVAERDRTRGPDGMNSDAPAVL